MSGETLGMLVKSHEHYETVCRLAHAAVEKGKKVLIHMLGEGIECIEQSGFEHLCRIAQVSVCETGLRALEKRRSVPVPENATIISPRHVKTIFCRCDRKLTF